MQAKLTVLLVTTALCCLGTGSNVAFAQSAAQQVSAENDAVDIVVTARRREERLQQVPVSIQAFSAETLVAQGIQSSDDLQKMVPGVVFSGAGGSLTTTYFIRGQGRDPIGPALPSVINYLNEVPLIANGALLPTYDVANLQVLKGPQGTLFGRNTTGGAVLATTKLPTFDVEGYLQGQYGSYDWVDVQGAVNIPIVADKLAVRFAGQLTRRDGYTKEQFNLHDRDDRHEDNGRVSVLLEPAEGIRNVTVLDYFHTDTSGPALVPTGNYLSNFLIYKQGFAQLVFGPQLGGIIADAFDCNTGISCNLDQQVERQAAAGNRKSFTGENTRAIQTVWGLSNTTSFDLGPVTVKNIFGYRHQQYTQNQDADGLPLVIVDTYQRASVRQVSNELQFSGSLLSDQLNWLVGGFYLKSTPDGANGGAYDQFRPASIPVNSWPLSIVQNALYEDETKAVFGNLGYAFLGALTGLRLSGSVRYTKDKEAACSLTTGPFSTPFLDGWAACLSAPGATTARTSFSKVTWQAGVDYKLNSDIFFYIDARTGYRAGQLNTPVLGTFLAPLQAFAPQTVMNYEVGLKTSWNTGGVSGRFNLSVFHSESKGLQRQIAGIFPNTDGDFNPLNDPSFTTLVINGGTVIYKGVEIDAAVNLTSDLSLGFAGAYLDTKFTKLTVPPQLAGQGGSAPFIDYAPKWSFSINGEYRLPIATGDGGVYLVGNYYWSDEYHAVLQVYPSHDVLDLSLQWRQIGGTPLTATAFVNNVTDSNYASVQSLNGSSPGFETVGHAAPRMAGLRVRYDF